MKPRTWRDQRSRFFHARHPLHGWRGRFQKGATLVTRWDGETRWLTYWKPPDTRYRGWQGPRW